ncbi:PAS domain-containing protein [Roseivirga sp. BDSF3-8]|uniref:PAS domain-containing protein n=1 Tax=Roseivirga sp. BDSF3-8 TaxID=3241598 RepID=UPI00353215EF
MSYKNARLLLTYLELTPVTYTLYDLLNPSLISLSNPSNLLGYSKKEIKGFSENYFEKIIHPADFPRVKDNLEKIKHSGCDEEITNRFRMLHRDGHYIWLQSYYRVMEAEGGVATKVAAATEDITDRVELEEQLREATDRLNDLSYRDSHLLRAPVANIIGLVDLVEKEGLINEANRVIVHHLKRTVEKLDGVIRDIYHKSESPL